MLRRYNAFTLPHTSYSVSNHLKIFLILTLALFLMTSLLTTSAPAGKWKGEQVISKEWLEEATSPKIKAGTLREYYGYQWWIDADDRILALGYSGQYLIIDPDLQSVTVFLSDLHDQEFFLPYTLYKTYIIPGIGN